MELVLVDRQFHADSVFAVHCAGGAVMTDRAALADELKALAPVIQKAIAEFYPAWEPRPDMAHFIAIRIAALRTTSGPDGGAVDYRNVIDEALVVRNLGVAKDDPRKELETILSWEVAVALDPRVSEALQALIDSGKASPNPVAGDGVREALVLARKVSGEIVPTDSIAYDAELRTIDTALASAPQPQVAAWKPITMQDIRLCAGEGKLPAWAILDVCNNIIRRRLEHSPATLPPSGRDAVDPVTVEAMADAIDSARYEHPLHPRERPRPFEEADMSDREYAERLARAAIRALSQVPASTPAAVEGER